MPLVNMSQLLDRANKKGVGVGAFNVGNMEMVKGVVKAAEDMNTPVIMQIAEGRLKYSPLHLMGPMMVEAAKQSTVDIAVHFDHGKSIEMIRQALEYGFTSVMFDGSSFDFEKNIEGTKAVVDLAHSFGADTEGELGVVGGSEGGEKDETIRYTDPDQAEEFVKCTGIDALAIAIGNAHGEYKGIPELNFQVLSRVKNNVDKPLVLHGGSGISDKDFWNAIQYGIRKVNIATANFNMLTAFASEYFKEGQEKKTFFGLNDAMVEGVYINVRKHIGVFNGKF